jgi:hypothetical protein
MNELRSKRMQSEPTVDTALHCTAKQNPANETIAESASFTPKTPFNLAASFHSTLIDNISKQSLVQICQMQLIS